MAWFRRSKTEVAEVDSPRMVESIRDVIPPLSPLDRRGSSGPLGYKFNTHFHDSNEVADSKCPGFLEYYTREGASYEGEFHRVKMGDNISFLSVMDRLFKAEAEGLDMRGKLDLDALSYGEHHTQLIDLANMALVLQGRYEALASVKDPALLREHQASVATLIQAITKEETRVASWKEQHALESLEGSDYDMESLDERVRRGAKVADAVTEARRVTLSKWREGPEQKSIGH